MCGSKVITIEGSEHSMTCSSSFVKFAICSEIVLIWIIIHEAANTSLYACSKYAEDIKLAKFQNRVQLEGLDYLPFVFESFGGLSMDTESFISKLATSISHRFGDSRHVVLAHFPKCCLHFKQKYSFEWDIHEN